ncbi:hypothetical protein [uncultured Hymenobacter sp.]|uniref:hypothetical protein n=1 Tax=uncultured Hymenobacter sp. TaxID=170016 RepID=UPI0035CB871B
MKRNRSSSISSIATPRWLWLICLTLLGACNDDPTTGRTRVQGQVVQQQSRQPVGAGSVQVYLASRGGGYRPVGDPYPCDAQGQFAFDFEAEQENGYLLTAEAPPGYITDWAVAPQLTAGRQNKDVTVPVLAPAWVRLVLVDEPPKSRVTMTITGYSGSGETLRYPKDTILVRPILAGLTPSIAWFINDQGQDKQSYQEIQTTALDTVTVRIPF